MSKDYGIILLPNDETAQQSEKIKHRCQRLLTARNISFSSGGNMPHLTLFQIRVDDIDLPKLTETLQYQCQDLLSFSFLMNDSLIQSDNYIFWCANEAKSVLRRVHSHIVTLASPYRSKSADFSQLTAYDKIIHAKDIDDYGIYWCLPHNFNPHITLVYNIETKLELTTIFRKIECPRTLFQTKAIAIAELGPYGEAHKIITLIKTFDSTQQGKQISLSTLRKTTPFLH